MDQSIQYVQVISNFDSVYNTSPNLIHRQPVVYMPSPSFSSHQHRLPSPSLSYSIPKFNLDFYKPNEYLSESIDYPSPSSSVIIHHHPVCSPSPPPPPPPAPSQAISKLRQLNDELCYTLAQSELNNYSQPTPANHHIHHYPIPHVTHYSHPISRRDSPSSSSTESDPPEPKKRNARITYKAHIPRRQNSLSKIDQLLISTSDAYSQNDPLTVDIYPTRDPGFARTIRNRPDNQNPWLADRSPVRRYSYSEASTYRTPRTPRSPDYENKPLQPKSRLSNCKERPRSSSVKSRFRPDSTPNPLRQSTSFFSASAPVWRPNGSIKPKKFMGSHAPPTKPKPPPSEARWNPAGTANKVKPFRAFDPGSKPPTAKAAEPVWRPALKQPTRKPPRYFEPTLKPELTTSIVRETEPVLLTKTIKNPNKIRGGDPKLKTRIANAESKVKSAWGPTTTPSEPRVPIPRPVKKAATAPIPAKVKPGGPIKKVIPTPATAASTGRSSLNDVPTKPLFQSTPRNQSIVHENDDNMDDLFENESQISEPTKKEVIPHPPPRIEKTPPKHVDVSASEPNKGTKSTIKNGVLIHGDDAQDNRTPSPVSEINNNDDEDDQEVAALTDRNAELAPVPPPRKASSPKLDNRDDESVVDEDDAVLANDADENNEQSFGMNKSQDAPVVTITPKNKQRLPSTPPPATTNNEADAFFDNF